MQSEAQGAGVGDVRIMSAIPCPVCHKRDGARQHPTCGSVQMFHHPTRQWVWMTADPPQKFHVQLPCPKCGCLERIGDYCPDCDSKRGV